MDAENVDLIVIGSGQGGVPLAVDAARAGKRVVVFERGTLGGTCVNTGCTPSKAFLAVAHGAGRARRAIDVGVQADVRVSGADALARARGIRDDWREGVEHRLQAAGVEVVRAEASFTGERIVSGGGRVVTAPHVVIDTGAAPAIPPIPGLADVRYLTSDSFFDQPTLPDRLIVIGAGYIGLELGQGSQRLGSAVTIVHSHDRILEREDADAVAAVQHSLERDGVRFVFDASIREVRGRGEEIEVVLADGTVLAGDGLFVATGRAPNTKALHLEAAGIACTARGFVAVDDYLRTACAGVFAIGDVAGQPAFTHVAWEDYRRVASTIAGTPRRRDDRVLSYSTFTEPQLARTGLGEAEAVQRGIAARTEVLSPGDIARGVEWDLTDGSWQLVVDTATEKIVGATLVGYETCEIVHTLAFAIHMGATWRDLDTFVAIHPTFCEGLPTLARRFAVDAADARPKNA
jgi:dihydrolipoamide dehydrogenase